MMEETIQKSLKNIYNLIEIYEETLSELTQNEQTNYEKLKRTYGVFEKKHLDFQISIYKNINYKLFPFTQIFDLKNETPYLLDSKETEIFRQYIGLYTNGEMETIEKLSKTFNCKESKIKVCIGNILESFMDLNVQAQVLNERNKIINENINNKKLKEKILNYDIRFLTMTNNLQQILNMNKIKTIRDLIEMNFYKLDKINFENGYNSKLITFPRRIIKEIHNLGLEFKTLEPTFKKMYESDKELPKEFLEQIKIELHTKNINTALDIINAQQFEPEIIKTLELKERIIVDENTNNSYKQNQYINMIEDIHINALGIINSSKKEETIERILRKRFPEMMDEEVYNTLNKIIESYGMTTPSVNEKNKIIKIQYTDKN